MVQNLIDKLTEPPLFQLPDATVAHTRHFMPKYRSSLDGKTDKIFDTFVALDKNAHLVVAWPNVRLDKNETGALEKLVANISYLGRAESWVEAEVEQNYNGEYNCHWINGKGIQSNTERVRVLGVQSPDEYNTWREGFIRSGTKQASRKKLVVPPSLWDALHIETSLLQKNGWSLAPGSRWLDYARPTYCFRVTYNRKVKSAVNKPTVARYALYGKPLPLLTDALFWGERLRQALMSQSKDLGDGVHPLPLFSGKNPDGTPLNDDHSHAFYLPSDEDDDGHLDHITVYAPNGFDNVAQIAIGRIKKLWQRGSDDLRLVLVGIGSQNDYGGFDHTKGLTRQLALSRFWISRTPFLLTRHPKTYHDGRPKIGADGLQIDSPEAQIRRELKKRGLPDPVSIKLKKITEAAGRKIRWIQFRRIRKSGGGRLANPLGYGFLLEFKEPIVGPLALGYGCHFGLGQFVAIDEV
jgi:CRISPR-associated protein Csb2